MSEILKMAGYHEEVSSELDELYRYTKVEFNSNIRKTKTIILKDGLFDEELNLLKLRKKSDVEENLIYNEVEEDVSDDDLPF